MIRPYPSTRESRATRASHGRWWRAPRTPPSAQSPYQCRCAGEAPAGRVHNVPPLLRANATPSASLAAGVLTTRTSMREPSSSARASASRIVGGADGRIGCTPIRSGGAIWPPRHHFARPFPQDLHSVDWLPASQQLEVDRSDLVEHLSRPTVVGDALLDRAATRLRYVDHDRRVLGHADRQVDLRAMTAAGRYRRLRRSSRSRANQSSRPADSICSNVAGRMRPGTAARPGSQACSPPFGENQPIHLAYREES